MASGLVTDLRSCRMAFVASLLMLSTAASAAAAPDFSWPPLANRAATARYTCTVTEPQTIPLAGRSHMALCACLDAIAPGFGSGNRIGAMLQTEILHVNM